MADHIKTATNSIRQVPLDGTGPIAAPRADLNAELRAMLNSRDRGILPGLSEKELQVAKDAIEVLANQARLDELKQLVKAEIEGRKVNANVTKAELSSVKLAAAVKLLGATPNRARTLLIEALPHLESDRESLIAIELLTKLELSQLSQKHDGPQLLAKGAAIKPLELEFSQLETVFNARMQDFLKKFIPSDLATLNRIYSDFDYQKAIILKDNRKVSDLAFNSSLAGIKLETTFFKRMTNQSGRSANPYLEPAIEIANLSPQTLAAYEKKVSTYTLKQLQDEQRRLYLAVVSSLGAAAEHPVIRKPSDSSSAAMQEQVRVKYEERAAQLTQLMQVISRFAPPPFKSGAVLMEQQKGAEKLLCNYIETTRDGSILAFVKTLGREIQNSSQKEVLFTLGTAAICGAAEGTILGMRSGSPWTTGLAAGTMMLRYVLLAESALALKNFAVALPKAIDNFNHRTNNGAAWSEVIFNFTATGLGIVTGPIAIKAIKSTTPYQLIRTLGKEGEEGLVKVLRAAGMELPEVVPSEMLRGKVSELFEQTAKELIDFGGKKVALSSLSLLGAQIAIVAQQISELPEGERELAKRQVINSFPQMATLFAANLLLQRQSIKLIKTISDITPPASARITQADFSESDSPLSRIEQLSNLVARSQGEDFRYGNSTPELAHLNLQQSGSPLDQTTLKDIRDWIVKFEQSLGLYGDKGALKEALPAWQEEIPESIYNFYLSAKKRILTSPSHWDKLTGIYDLARLGSHVRQYERFFNLTAPMIGDIKAVALDLNGTLETGGKIPERSVVALKNIQELGGKTAIISGWDIKKIRDLLAANDLDPSKLDIYADGGGSFYPAGGGSSIHAGKGRDTPELAKITKVVHEVLEKAGALNQLNRSKLVFTDDYRIILNFEDVTGQPRAISREIRSKIESQLWPIGFGAMPTSNGRYLEILPRGVDKSSALEHFGKRHSVAEPEILKIGNEPLGNDEPLLYDPHRLRSRDNAYAVRNPDETSHLLERAEDIVRKVRQREKGEVKPTTGDTKLSPSWESHVPLRGPRISNGVYEVPFLDRGALTQVVDPNDLILTPGYKERLPDLFIAESEALAADLVPTHSGYKKFPERERRIFIADGDRIETYDSGREYLLAKNLSDEEARIGEKRLIESQAKHSAKYPGVERDKIFLHQISKEKRELFSDFVSRNEKLVGPAVVDATKAAREVPLTPEVRAWFLLDYLSSKKGSIRREDRSYRSPELDEELVRKFAADLKEGRTVRVFLMSFLPKFAGDSYAGGSYLPDATNVRAIENLNEIAAGAKEIAPEGVTFIVGYEGNLYLQILNLSTNESDNTLKALKAFNQESAKRRGFKKSPVEFVDVDRLIVGKLEEDADFRAAFKLVADNYAHLIHLYRSTIGTLPEPERRALLSLTPQERRNKAASLFPGEFWQVDAEPIFDFAPELSEFLERYTDRIDLSKERGSSLIEKELPHLKGQTAADRAAVYYFTVKRMKYVGGADGQGILSLLGETSPLVATVGRNSPGSKPRMNFQLVPGAEALPHRSIGVHAVTESGMKWESRSQKELVDSGKPYLPRYRKGETEPLYYSELKVIEDRSDPSEVARYGIREFICQDEFGKKYRWRIFRAEDDSHLPRPYGQGSEALTNFANRQTALETGLGQGEGAYVIAVEVNSTKANQSGSPGPKVAYARIIGPKNDLNKNKFHPTRAEYLLELGEDDISKGILEGTIDEYHNVPADIGAIPSRVIGVKPR